MTPILSADELAELVRICRQHPKREVALPAALYSQVGGHPVVRMEIDGIRVLLHRWLFEQINEQVLGGDLLRRRPGVDPRNVNPFLFDRISRHAPVLREVCPNGHRYAAVGEVSGLVGVRCARCRSDRLARRRVGAPSQADLNRAKTHCPRNHEYTEENTLYRKSDKGARRCATCERDRMAGRVIQPRERTLR